MNYQAISVSTAAGRLSRTGSVTVDPRLLLSAVVVVLMAQNLLLWRFLGVTSVVAYAAGLMLAVGVVVAVLRNRAAEWQRPSLRTFCLLAVVSVLILMLGGEGGVFYANADWQVRDAVLRDLTVNAWPFAYRQNGGLELLRAPIGMFLIPALIAKAFGAIAADVALLVQNSLLLTLLLGLGSTLFNSTRARLTALAVVILFSGMDIVGQLLNEAATGAAFPDHLERWAGSQYSSHITQAFWVPQHAMAGWIGALLFLLWRERRISLGQMYAPFPLLMLLSPLGVMGALPFAAYAGVATLAKRQLRLSDFVLPAATCLLSIPAILYLTAGGDKVGFRLLSLAPDPYLLFVSLEVLVFAIPVALINRTDGRETGTLLLVILCLAAAPFVQLGQGMDFTMRVSISALAILAAQVAWSLSRPLPAADTQRPARAMLLVAVAVGSVTGMFEIARAVRFEATPQVHCSLTSAADASVDLPHGSSNATYFAPLDALPSGLRADPVSIVVPEADAACWERPWKVSRFG